MQLKPKLKRVGKKLAHPSLANGVNVHYIYNKKTGEFTDFKFKDK